MIESPGWSASREPAGPDGGRIRPDLEEVLAGLEGPIGRPPVRPLYRVGLALVALAMVALSLAYVGLIGAAVFAVWLAADAIRATAAHPTAGIVVVSILGGLFVLFLVKPLLARPGRAAARGSLELSRDRQPHLFALVDRLCAVVGSPSPSRILVDAEPNASASPRHGLVSLFRRDLVLTIGLPLAGALDLRAFAGVLAHELGHFAQGAGMALTYVVRAIDGWFARVCCERDRWDESLDAVARWLPLVEILRACIGGSRALLRGFLHAGHAISCFALRQMEYDADRYQALLAGADALEETMQRLPELAAAEHAAWSELGALRREGRLADDVPELILARHRSLPAEARAELRKAGDADRTARFDTHPSARDRIAAVRSLGAEGLVRDRRPARALFVDFEALSREATLRVYRARLGPETETIRLVPVRALFEDAATDDLARAALERVVGGSLHASIPLLGGEAGGAGGTAEERAKAAREVAEAMDRILLLARAYSCMRAGRSQLAKGVGSPPPPPDDVRARIHVENGRFREARERARRAFAAVSRRLASAPASGRLLAGSRAIESAWPLVEKVAALAEGLRELAPIAHEAGEDGRLAGHLATMAGRIRSAHMEVAAALSDSPHPFLDEPLGAHAIGSPPLPEPGPALEAAGAMVESLSALRLRALGRLALAAERASDGNA